MKTYQSRQAGTGLAAVALALSLFVCERAQAQDRMPPIPPGKMTEAQKQAVADFTAARGPLTGPWAALLRSPELVNRGRPLSDYLRFHSVLPPRISEFVILIVARQWSQPYEWNAHQPLALKGGLSPDIVNAVADGRRPERMAEDEAAAYDYCMELHTNRSVSDATYARALSKFGEQGIIDMVGLSGWYTLVSMTLNSVRTPLPAQPTSVIAPFPR